MLAPKRHIHFESAPMYGNFQTTGHHIFLSYPIEYDVDRRYENLPHTVDTEEVAQHIKVFALQCGSPTFSLLHISQWMHFQEQLTWQFFQCGNFESQLTDILYVTCEKVSKQKWKWHTTVWTYFPIQAAVELHYWSCPIIHSKCLLAYFVACQLQFVFSSSKSYPS